MAKKLSITRRDFMNGFAMSLTAGTALSPFELLAMNEQMGKVVFYPPELTGMRGSHPGSFEVAHALAEMVHVGPSLLIRPIVITMLLLSAGVFQGYRQHISTGNATGEIQEY